VGSYAPSSPSESFELRTASALAAPLPWGSLGDGLGALPIIACRCWLYTALRSGSSGLSRILPGLTLGSVTRPERTFEVFRSASLTCPHRCEPAIDPLCRSPPELSALLPGPAHADLLSWGWTKDSRSPCRLCPSPLRRPSLRTPLTRSPCASTPGRSLAAPTFGLGMPIPRSRSVLVVLHHLDGFLRARLAGLLHPAADPGVRLVSCAAEAVHSPRRYHPSKNVTDPPWALRSPGALAPLMFPLSRGCHLRGCFRRIGP